MRKAFIIILSLFFLAGTFLLLRESFPKSKGVIPLFILLLVFDGYIWICIKDRIHALKHGLIPLVYFFYWLPLLLLVSSFIAGMFVSFIDWNIPLRTYLLGFIVIGYFCKLFPAVFYLLADFLRLLQYLVASFQHGPGTSMRYTVRNSFLVSSGWISGLIFFLILLYGVVEGNYKFQVREVNISLAELPSSFDGLKIVQLSDIHLGSWTSAKKLGEAVALVNDLKPDLIFVTGDLVNYCTTDVGNYGPVLQKLTAKEGVFSILGNHDYGAYIHWNYQELKTLDHIRLIEFEKSMGWRLLLNENYILKRAGDSIAILGVENWGVIARFQRMADIPKTQRGIENMKVKLLLSHDPSYWDKVISRDYKDVDITFSGHTHAYQFGLECFGIRWSPAQFSYKEWGGLFSRGGKEASQPQYIYVNRGLGSIGYPGRVCEWPEITLFTLRKAN